MKVITDYMSSDHMPISMSLVCNVEVVPVTKLSVSKSHCIDRQNVSQDDINKYQLVTAELFSCIVVPKEALRCNDVHCTLHSQAIDNFYDNIVTVLQLLQISASLALRAGIIIMYPAGILWLKSIIM